MSEIFVGILGTSLSTGILIVILLLLSPLVNHRYAAKWRFWIWAVIAVRLLVPVSGFPSGDDVGAYSPQTQYLPDEAYRQEQTYPRIEIAIPQQLVEPINQPEEILSGGSVKKAVSPLSVISCVWMAGAIVLFAAQLSSFLLYKRKIKNHGCKLTEGLAYDTFISLREEMALRGRLELICSSDAPTPMIMGYLKPIMVLPRSDYTEEQMSFIIKHELIHFKRRDIWIKLLMAAAVSVHWFNPLVWMMRRRADVDMELSVDDGVVAHAGFDVRKAYTEVLYSTIGDKSPAPSGLSTGFNGGKRILKKRFYNIMTKFNKKSGAVLLCVVAALIVIVGAVIGFSRIPESISSKTLDEDEMYSLIMNSLTIDGYLNTEPPAYDFNDTADYQGMTYYRVIDEKYDDWSEWEEYLGSVYTGDMLQAMLENTTVVNIDGKTYCDGGGRGSDWTGRYESIGQYDLPGERMEKRVGALITRMYVTDDGEGVAAFDYVFRYTKETGWRIESVERSSEEEQPIGGGENEEAVPEPESQPEPENAEFTVPDWYTKCQVSMRATHLEKPEGAPSWQLTDYETDNYLSVRFALPENWKFNGFSVADDENGKALEIGNPFPADDYNPDFFRKFPVGTELPKDYTPVDGEAGNVRVLEEGEHEWSPEEPYLFKRRSIISFYSGDYENLTYIIRDGEWCMYVNFTKTDPDDAGFEERCEYLLRTFTIAQIVTLNQTVSVSAQDYALGDGREFDLNFWLLDGMTVSQAEENDLSDEDKLYLYLMPNKKWYIYNADGVIVGAVSFDAYEPYPEEERNEKAIYAQITLGSGWQFDVNGTYKPLISNETYEIAVSTVRRGLSLGMQDDFGDKENFGILTYNTELNVYVAFEFDSELIDQEDVEVIAGSIWLDGRE